MGLKIIISSAVKLEEKTQVKAKLREMERLHLIKIDELYDCADHATSWGVESKQEAINRKILSADWFICLIPGSTVGEATWGELKLILEAHKKGLPVSISVFHPHESPLSEESSSGSAKMLTFTYIKEQAEVILGNKEEQYWVSYQYDNHEDLLKSLNEEFIRLYYTDKVFRTQHLSGLAKLGCNIKANELYFDKERASIANGFIENKYFPRRSVDGKLQESLIEQRKFTILLGAPGSGKTRAVYQLLADSRQLALFYHELYALGHLALKNVIVVHQDNIRQVYQFLESEKDYDESNDTLSEYYLVCDQLKDVFGMLTNEELFTFFDMVVKFKHVHMIATSIPSAYNNFCERWKDYGRKPLEDDQQTKVITIPPISSDDEEGALRNWMQNELQGNSAAETIGDYIPKLNSYKQDIVKKIYGKNNELPCLAPFLSAVQIIETYRHDTALFLAILLTRKNIYPKEQPTSLKKFYQEMTKALNFLIANNVIWIRLSSSSGDKSLKVIKAMHENAFSLEYGMDDDEDFTFDGEMFDGKTNPETPISTAYLYGVNEIVWNELEQEDANRHMNNKETLLKDFQNVKDVVRSAKEFYRSFPSIKSIRRLLPRIPHTDCYDEAAATLWDFVYEKCAKTTPQSDELEEFLIAIGMLIGRSVDLAHIKTAISIIQDKGFRPDYNIIGELYSASQRLGKESKPEISQYVTDIRSKYQLTDNTFFSLSREIEFNNMSFDTAIDVIKNSKYKIYGKNGCILLPLQETVAAIELKTDMISLEKLLAALAKKGETVEQWIDIFKLYQQTGICLRRSTIRQFFADVANHSMRLQRDKNYEEPENLMKAHLQTLLTQFSDIIADEDKESCFFYSIISSWNFKQARPIYQQYLDTYGEDNPRLISTILVVVRDHEFQNTLNFLIEADKRLKEKGQELNDICFNNLIKTAPNMGEALGVVPYLTHLHDHTLPNVLTVLKNKRRLKDKKSKTGRKQDSKVFYYAYSAVMRDIFFDQRKNPYVIGILYDLATTPKHERFIRDTFLSHLKEGEKRKIIDYSTGISSIRLQKNYRTLDDVWDIFNTCRNHYRDENMYLNSELYSNMMRKLRFLCTDEGLLKQQQDRLRSIVNEDFSRIIRDEYFFSAMYRFFPEKEIIDAAGNISRDFIKDIKISEISHIKPLNNIMMNLKSRGFDIVWKFYEFIVKYYQHYGKRRMLRPDIRTVTCLMETVQTKEQFNKADEAARQWVLDVTLKSNKIYRTCYATKSRKLGYDAPVTNNDAEEVIINDKRKSPRPVKLDYKQRTNEIIDLAVKDIYLYGRLTPTLFNRYLNEVSDVIDDIGKDQLLTNDIARRCKAGTYRNLLTNLIEKYLDDICFDAISYVYLIKLAPGEWDVKRWIKKLQEKEDIYKYDMVVCATIAQNTEVCKADIDTALDYFEFWENIVNDIGYDPDDPMSISETTEVTLYNNKNDYDGYWLTRSTHCIREMSHYWNCLKKDNYVDKTALRFIKQQMDFFEQHDITYPKLMIKGRSIDFKQEILKLS